jgi:mono/diheme cytochrome c family protein
VRRLAPAGPGLGLALAALLAAACGSGERSFEAPVVLGGTEVPPEVLNRGELVYMRHCRGCHGARGRGDGRYASSMSPRPADLTAGEYPRLGATGGELPTDEALRRAIVEGLEGTGMTPQPIEGENLEAVVQYVKTLSPAWR